LLFHPDCPICGRTVPRVRYEEMQAC